MAAFGDPGEWAVVMPSIRTINPEYLKHVPEDVRVIVVDDSNGSIEANRSNMAVYRYNDYRSWLGENDDLIPRKTDTCRSFGFYVAWREGYQYVVTLDDDCKTHEGFMDGHALVGHEREVPTVDQLPWYNTLDNLVLEIDGQPSPRFYARGVPYCYREHQPEPVIRKQTGRVVCNMGMWTKVPDINGLDKLGVDVPEAISVREPCLAIGRGTEFSLCIMNVAIMAEAIPAFYQLPMGASVCGHRLDRFGDIWSGYILKRLTDIKGDLVTIGEPAVTHTKAGNTIRETQVEHFGHLVERDFYGLVDRAAEATAAADYATMYNQFATNFVAEVERSSLVPAYRSLFADMGEKMVRWSHLFLPAAGASRSSSGSTGTP
ncbi:MAG: hypothetical protein ACF8TS_12995 [Maioricimonas sp. JB049]